MCVYREQKHKSKILSAQHEKNQIYFNTHVALKIDYNSKLATFASVVP